MDKKFNIIRKGYDIAEVDKAITALEEELEEFKKKELAINSALITAQITADNIIKKAEIEASDLKEETHRQLDDLKKLILDQKRNLGEFYDDYTRLMKRYIKPINSKEVDPLLSKIDRIAGFIDESQKKDANLATTKVYPPEKETDNTNTENNDKLNDDSDNARKEPPTTPASGYETASALEEDDNEIIFKFPRSTRSAQDEALRELLKK